jgi:dimethylargininase
LKRAIVCSPENEYFSEVNLKAHNITRRPDQKKSKQQHNVLKTIIEKSGCEVIDVPELPGHPNSVYTRDTAVCTPEGYIKLWMGLNTRRGEEDWMAGILDSLGEPNVGFIEQPATVEGGDIILAGPIAFIGHSQRTNQEGTRQISSLLFELGYEIRSVDVPPFYLHLGGAMSIIEPDYVLCCKGIFPDNFFRGFEKIEVESNSFISGNVICLGNREIIADCSNHEAIQKLEKAGFSVKGIDLSEFVKGTGGPSCLILPIK